jgi:hypothetical protein
MKKIIALLICFVLLPRQLLSMITWQELTGNTAVCRAAAVAYNGKIYVLKGKDAAGNATTAVQIYDIATQVWSAGTADTGNPQQDFAAVLYNGKIYCFGGRSATTTYLSSMRIYDIAGDSWSGGTAHSHTVWGQGGVLSGSKIYYLFGGQATVPSTLLLHIHIYDPVGDSWTESSDDLYKSFAVGYAEGGYIYVRHGWNNGGAGEDSLRKYDVAGDSFSALTADGETSDLPAISGTGGVIVSCGYTANADACYTYNITNDAWTAETDLISNQGYSYNTGCVYQGFFYMYGGLDGVTVVNTFRRAAFPHKIGLRVRSGSSTVEIGGEGLLSQKLRIRKGGITYAIPIVATNHPLANKIRIYDGTDTKSLAGIN